MPFDIFTMAAIEDELSASIVGSRVDKIIQPAALSIAFKLWSRGLRWLASHVGRRRKFADLSDPIQAGQGL